MVCTVCDEGRGSADAGIAHNIVAGRVYKETKGKEVNMREKCGKQRKIRYIKSVITVLCMLFLSGCTARELEDRAFPQAMELELSGNELIGGFGSELVSGETIEDLKKEAQMKMDKYLDLGHVKVIVLGEKLLDDEMYAESVMRELERMPSISGNCLVLSHSYEEKESYLKKLEELGKNPGEYLSDLKKNNPYQKSSSAKTLAELLGS